MGFTMFVTDHNATNTKHLQRVVFIHQPCTKRGKI